MGATFGVIAALTITTASITDGNGRIATGVDNSTNEYQRIHWYARFETGTSPTVDTLIELYFFREDDHATQYVSDGETLTDGALSTTPQNAQLVGTMVVTAVSDTMFYVEGVVEDPGPGRWAMGFMNETGATLSTTEADGFIHWVGEKA
jgi:hypothetical protein